MKFKCYSITAIFIVLLLSLTLNFCSVSAEQVSSCDFLLVNLLSQTDSPSSVPLKTRTLDASILAGFFARYLIANVDPSKRAGFLKNIEERGIFGEFRLPRTLISVLLKMDSSEKTLFSDAFQRQNVRVLGFMIRKHLVEEFKDPQKFRAAFVDYDDFFGHSTGLSSVFVDGKINRGFFDLLPDRPEEKPDLNFIITINPATNQPQMRLGVAATQTELRSGLPLHPVLARGESVVFAGEIKLRADGSIRWINLESGHYMKPRYDSIFDLLSRSPIDGEKVIELEQEIAQRDLQKLRFILGSQLKLDLKDTTLSGRFER